MTENPDFANVTRLWMTKFGKLQTYTDLYALRGGLIASLLMPDEEVEIRRVGQVLLVMPGAPYSAPETVHAIRPGAVIELDDQGENFSATLTRSEASALIDALPEHDHTPVRVALVNGTLELFSFNIEHKVKLTYKAQRRSA